MHGQAKKDSQVRSLENTVKYHLPRANKAAKTTNEHEMACGEALKELKRLKPYGSWDAYVRREFDIGQSRADELIRIFEGKTTVEEVRAKDAEKKRKSRAKKSAGRPADSSEPEDEETNVVGFNKFRRNDGEVKSSCDFNPEDPEDVAEKNDTPAEIRHRIFMHHASEAIRHARENGLDKAQKKEITPEVISVAQQAAQAWTDLAEELERRGKRST